MDSTGSSSSTTANAAALEPAVIVGIASYNNADTIGDLARAVSAGLAPYGARASIVVADGGSTDQTVRRVHEAVADSCAVTTVEYSRPTVIDPLRTPYHGLVGRPAAIRAILRTAQDRQAKACAFVDGSLTSLTPDWVARLIDPVVIEACDYVSPHYLRHVHEGAITKCIVYPLFRALYGLRVREPSASEFACSSQFVQHVLDQGFWEAEGAQTGIDFWLATAAATNGFRACESAFGARTHAPRADMPDVSTTLVQVVGPVFSDIEARADAWQRVRRSVAVPLFGDPPTPGATPADIDIEQMLETFRLGYHALRDVWAWVVQPRTILQLKRLADTPTDKFRLDDELWTQVVYDFALAYRLHSMPREHLLGSLSPLYRGWLAGFIMEVRNSPPADADQRLDQLSVMFERKKPYLISGWRWPERFRA